MSLTLSFYKKNYTNLLSLCRSPSLFKKEILGRIANIAYCSMMTIAASLDTLAGLAIGVLSLLTMRKFKKINHFDYLLGFSRSISAFPISLLLTMVNITPNIEAGKTKEQIEELNRQGYKPPLISREGNGLLTQHIESVEIELDHDGFFKREIITRLKILLKAIAMVITRIVDLIIGSLALVAMILTLKKFQSLTNLAFRGFQITGLINDCWFNAIAILNPRTSFYTLKNT